MPRDSEDSSDEEKPPTAEEVEEFLRHNKVDDRAAQDLRECPPEVQKRVLTRGDLNSARNPSAAVLVRIRDARVEDKPQRGRTASRPMGLPSSSEVNGYIKANGVNEVAAQALRSCSPTVKRTVLSSGDVIGAFDPSAALLAKIKDVRAGGTGNINLSSMGMMPSMPSATDIDAFVEYNDLDESAEAQLRACPPYVISLVLGKGDLRGTRNPSSVVLSRIREAKAAPPPPMPVHMPPPGAPFPGHVPPFGYPPPGPPGHPFAFPPHGAPPPFGPHGYPPPHMMPPGYPHGPPGYYGPPGYPGPYAPPAAGGPYGAPVAANGRPSSRSYSYSYSRSRSDSRRHSRSSRSRSRKRKEIDKKEKKDKKEKEKKEKEREKAKEKEKEKDKDKDKEKDKKGKKDKKDKAKEKDKDVEKAKEKDKEKKAKKEKKR